METCPTNYFIATESSQINLNDLICTYDVTAVTSVQEAQNLIEAGKCAKWYLPSTSSEYHFFNKSKIFNEKFVCKNYTIFFTLESVFEKLLKLSNFCEQTVFVDAIWFVAQKIIK